MELESLKEIWQSVAIAEEQDQTPAEGQGQIMTRIEQRSGGALARMRRNIFGELVLILLVYSPAILFYRIGFGGRLPEIAWLLSALLLVFAIFFYRMNRLLLHMQSFGSTVRTNMERQVTTLQQYIRFYVIFGTVMIPVSIALTFLIIHWKIPQTAGSDLYYRLVGYPWWKDPRVWVWSAIPLTIAVYFLNVWYVNRLYGRHLARFKRILQEMDEL